MPDLDLELVDEELRAAAVLLGRRMPASYPTDPASVYIDSPRRAGLLDLVTGAGEELLALAHARELAAREAQGRIVRALRHLGGASPSWAAIGGRLGGLSQQGAHKRFAAIAAAPKAQLTIGDAAGLNLEQGRNTA